MEFSTEGSLLHQCLPISAMTLFDDNLLVLGEGPCILFLKPNHQNHNLHQKFVRHQLFPNQLTVTGIHWVEDSCGGSCRNSQWNGFDENHSVAFVWAGNHGTLVTLDHLSLGIKEEEKFPGNVLDSLAFNYIPIAARWFNEGRTLVLLSVFNYVVVYERTQAKGSLKGLKEVAKFECEQENLYSGTMIGDKLEDLVVFSGTTFQGILVWNVDKDGKTCVRHKLMGHKGIPFSLEFDIELRILVSASDDRNVILWSFSDGDNSKKDICADETMQKTVEMARISHKFTGHEARCWKAIPITADKLRYILSVGEDSSIRVHGLNNKFSKVWKAHDGASIYHCAYSNKNDILFTAAHDGSVFQWRRFYQETESALVPFDVIPRDVTFDGTFAVNEKGRSMINKDYPRSISLWSHDLIVASMDSGRIVGFQVKIPRQFELYADVRFKRYSVIGICDKNDLALVGGLAGDLVALKFTDSFKESIISGRHIVDRFASAVWTDNIGSKILNIVWLNEDEESLVLIVCLEKAFVYRIGYIESQINISLLKTFDLSLERPGLPAACLKSDILILGDETGNLITFSLKSNMDSPIQTIKGVHQEGVTSIVKYNGAILTSGRYGGIKSFRLEGLGLETKLLQIHEFIPPFEWVGKLLPIKNQDLLLVGFQKGDVVLYSWKDKRILTEIVNVGGGHRRWDVKFTNGEITFSYIRDKEIYCSVINLVDCIDSILKSGLHCKTVNCGIELKANSTGIFLATGSEDGTIRVFQYDPTSGSHFPIHEINNHASSVRTLASINIDERRSLLFSAGGRSEVLAFHLGLDGEELTPCGRITLVKSRNRDTEIDTRIMDLKVVSTEDKCIFCFCACSDGVVRILRYSLSLKRFIVVSLLQGNNHCVTKLQIISYHASLLVFGVTTNGYIIAWNWNPPQSNQKFEFIKNPEKMEATFSYKIRDAAIMSFKMVASRNSQEYSLVVGSDDSSVSCWMTKVPEDIRELDSSSMKEVFVENQSQRGAVVDVDIVINDNNSIIVYSCSNDQVISRLDGTNGNILGKTFAGVSDCQGFIVNSNQRFVTCYGNGISWVEIP